MAADSNSWAMDIAKDSEYKSESIDNNNNIAEVTVKQTLTFTDCGARALKYKQLDVDDPVLGNDTQWEAKWTKVLVSDTPKWMRFI